MQCMSALAHAGAVKRHSDEKFALWLDAMTAARTDVYDSSKYRVGLWRYNANTVFGKSIGIVI